MNVPISKYIICGGYSLITLTTKWFEHCLLETMNAKFLVVVLLAVAFAVITASSEKHLFKNEGKQ